MIRIFGVKGSIKNIENFLKKINIFSQNHSVTVQVMNADAVYGKLHLLSAAEHAIRAMRQQRNSTNSLAMESLLYASGERQIKLAIQKLGVKPGRSKVAFVVIDKLKDVSEASGTISAHDIGILFQELHVVRYDKVLEGDRKTLKTFGITDEELATVTQEKYGQMILEKVAMVDVIK